MDCQKVVKYFENKLNTGVSRNRRKYYKTAISAMQELQEYKKLGTLEEVRESIQELQIYKENEKRDLFRKSRFMDECRYRHENGNCLRVGGFCTSVPLSHCQRYKDWYTECMEYNKKEPASGTENQERSTNG